MSSSSTQQPQAVADNKQAGPHVGKHCHPHGRVSGKGKRQKHCFDAQGQHYVLHQYGFVE